MLMLYHFDCFSLHTCRLCDVSGETCGFPVCKRPISTDVHDRRWQSVQRKSEFPWWAGPGAHCWGWHREAAKPGPYQCWRMSSDSVEVVKVSPELDPLEMSAESTWPEAKTLACQHFTWKIKGKNSTTGVIWRARAGCYYLTGALEIKNHWCR